MTQQGKDVLESFIDGYGLASVLDALGEICGGKAVHIAENWQDIGTAKIWSMAATKVEALAGVLRREPELRVDRPNELICNRCNTKIRPEGGHRCDDCGRNI